MSDCFIIELQYKHVLTYDITLQCTKQKLIIFNCCSCTFLKTLLAKRKKQYAENPEKQRAACAKYYREHKEVIK